MKVKLQFFPIPVIIALFILFTADLSAQSQCNYTWTPQTSGTVEILNSVKAVSSTVCWVCGTGETVRRTTDGGATWINANPNPGVITGNVSAIEALNADNAWCSTSSLANTIIYKTTNGGNSWVQVYSNTGGFINGIKMTSSTAGYAFGNPLPGTFLWNILVTSDAGSTWQPLPTRPQGSAGEQGFVNCVQVLMSNIWFGSSSGEVYRSSNGGVNWTSAVTPGIVIYVQALHFNSPVLGLASGNIMDKTTNGGASFDTLPVPGTGNISAIEGVGNDFWFVRGSQIYRSSNSGAVWTLQFTTAFTLLAMDFVDNLSGCQMGWAAGTGGTVVKMTGLPTGTSNNQNTLPETYKLEQNYPNPFNPTTTIKYSIPLSKGVSNGRGILTRLTVTDILGRQVAVLVNGYKPAGNYSVNFDASNIPSGVYFYKLEAGDFSYVKKMVVMK